MTYTPAKQTPTLAITAWTVGLLAIVTTLYWRAGLGVVPVVALVISIGLTVAARTGAPGSHRTAATVTTGLAALLNVGFIALSIIAPAGG
ncbi:MULTISPECIES: hypothetical protein [unclassified Pseudonocardia]|uniref:hypothetical protein n=1 Tax=unclassified Pseudonocardia TaxID=2619320 RepID=UPI0001FFEEAC|nr:hypothetical protein [Pseudonocardia sp. Ae707_Ps1]OLM09226.1 hypothetical protein Ae707Ps1_6173 [Pseudonocardia sp. Ae707_Ps1]